ncbi:protein kinase domain-containing protein [Nannocystis pusilla]|uniref:serine/threonine-protein kinase n=1 Tax=Nannocystis pusilla TaxID=889268 RepID=UPI003B7E781B
MVTPSPQCPDESALLDFAAGALDSAARADLERHVDGCVACFEVLAALSAPADAQAPSGAAGRYSIERVRGSGAMGVVYEAHDPVLDRTVAVKVLRADLQPTEQRRLRLLREAQSLARIDHPNVVAVHDAGEAGPDVYIAMELIDGEPLDVHLRRQPRGWREVVDLFAQAGEGLAAAHAAGLVHRDFKPSNVLVDARGRVVVTDFGLAAPLDASDQPPAGHDGSLLDHNLSATAARLGTPAYMAPEQFSGGRATAHTDQFAFCVALVEALSGQRPFAGTSAEMWTRAQARGPDLSRLPGPARLARVLARGLAYEPTARHPSMRALLAELRACQALRRRRIAAALATAALAGAATYAWLVTRPPAGCDAPLADAWGPQRRADVAARLASDTAADGEAGGHLRSSKQRALAGLDAYSDALAGAYAAVCPELPRTIERALASSAASGPACRAAAPPSTLSPRASPRPRPRPSRRCWPWSAISRQCPSACRRGWPCATCRSPTIPSSARACRPSASSWPSPGSSKRPTIPRPAASSKRCCKPARRSATPRCRPRCSVASPSSICRPTPTPRPCSTSAPLMRSASARITSPPPRSRPAASS